MNPIFTLAGLNKPNYEPFSIGVEVEAEGVSLPAKPDIEDTMWKPVRDGSLRGESCEYILKKPLPVNAALKELKNLKEIADAKGTKFDFSNRTSVHVHYNVMPFTVLQIANIVCTYYLLEDVLLRYCGEDRVNNRFCLSVRNAEGIIGFITSRLTERNVFTFNEEACKYSALNLAAIGKQGSIEFRGMRGTLDIKVLTKWIKTIDLLVKRAIELPSPSTLFTINIGEFASKILDKDFFFDGWQDQVAYNLSICSDMFFKLGEQVKKELKPKREVLLRKGKEILGLQEGPIWNIGHVPAPQAPIVILPNNFIQEDY